MTVERSEGRTRAGDAAWRYRVGPNGALAAAASLAIGLWAVALLAPPAVLAAPGELDSSFGIGGLVLTDFGSGNLGRGDDAYAVAIQPDGKIVVAGDSYGYQDTADFALARHNTDGILDTTFGAGGLVLTEFHPGPGFSWEHARAVAIQPDGKIVAAGETSHVGEGGSATNPDFALARYHPNGTLDATFGGDGRVQTDLDPSGWDSRDEVMAVVIQNDRKILVAGESDHDFALARYNPDGTLDPTFGSGGRVLTDFAPGRATSSSDRAHALAIQPGGKIVVAGTSWTRTSFDFPPSQPDFALARYRPNGRLDRSFGRGGLVLTDFAPGPTWSEDYAFAVALQPDGKILVVGGSYVVPLGEGVSGDFALARYKKDGRLDATFGSGGLVLTDFFPGLDAREDWATAVAIQNDGKVVAAGGSYGAYPGPGGLDFALARYHPNGTLDAFFGIAGRLLTDLGSTDWVEALAIQKDGGIVAAGGTWLRDFALARYLME
jgi:uncharacterized delta-60 repeat protein